MPSTDPAARDEPDDPDHTDQRVRDAEGATLHGSTGGDIPGDLSRSERRALELIRERGGRYQSEVWKELDVSSRTGTRIARALASRGLVERTESTYRGRKTYLLTPVERETRTTGGSTSSVPSSTDESATGGETRAPEREPALTEIESRALELVVERGPVPQRELVQLLGLSTDTGEQLVQTLVDADRIEREETRLYGRRTNLLIPIERGGLPDCMPGEGAVEYEPVSVKEVLAEMKDTAELLIDLSYSAVLLGSDDIAEAVLDLEDRMDVLQMQGRMSLLLAARSPEDAEALAPVLGVVGAAEKVSDAAGDIAKVVLEEVGLPDAMRAALPEAVETLVRAEADGAGKLVGRSLGELNLETETGVRVIAVRRDGDWLLEPDAETALEAGDVAILRGPEAAVPEVYEDVTGRVYEPPSSPPASTDDLERAVDSIVLMKNMSELAVDLAYGAVLFDSEGLAEEVFELEAEVDALESRFVAWILRAAARVDDPVSLRGLVRLANSTEVISDAALEISEGVLRGLGTHPVIAEAVLESDEVIVRYEVQSGSRLDGTTLGDAMVKTETGMSVIAVRRHSANEGPPGRPDEWVVQPGPGTVLGAGDVFVAKGTRDGAARLADLAGEEPATEA